MATHDPSNPFDQPGHWPRLQQGPMRVGPLPKAVPWPPAWQHEPAPAIELQPESAALAPTPQIAAPAPNHAAAALPELTDADLAIPAPSAMAMPFAARGSRVPMRQPSRLIPVLVACGVGLAGVGLLAYLMNEGQHASAPAPPPTLPAPVAVAAPTPEPQPVVAPPAEAAPPVAIAPVKTAAAAVRKAASQALPKLDVPAAEPAPRRISIPPPVAAPEPAVTLQPRAHPSDPEAPISTNTPN